MPPLHKKLVVIGAGFTGLGAAYDLARAGFEVTIVERDEQIGGLAGTFEVAPGVPLEKFYHHWFSSDVDILTFLKQLGGSDRISLRPSNTGLYYANSIFRLASPLDLLRFTPLPFWDRVRTGMMAVYARSIRDYRPLEQITALEWIRSVAGRRSCDVIWEPLLRGKFGEYAEEVSAVWFWNKLKLRGSSRGKNGAEQLAYFQGGFAAVLQLIRERLSELGVTIRTGCAAEEILVEKNVVCGVRTAAGVIPAAVVLCTAELPNFLKMTPALPAPFSRLAAQIKFLGNVCLVLSLRRSLSSTYWLNVADPSFPFVGVIEHTNLDSIDNYAGKHVAFLSQYLPSANSLFHLSDNDYFDYALPFLQRIFPDFQRDWVLDFRIWRAQYSQPVVTKDYSLFIPPHKTPIENLWLSTMAQIYPEDRGTNYALRSGRAIARRISESSIVGSL